MEQYTIRLLQEEDVDALCRIENACFRDPWSREAFAGEFRNGVARYFGLFLDREMIGYIGVWLVIDEGHITNLAVLPENQGNGYGEILLRHLIEYCASMGIVWMTLEVRRSNLRAQNLYHKCGFQDVGYRKRYYQDNQEDALLMIKEEMPQVAPRYTEYME